MFLSRCHLFLALFDPFQPASNKAKLSLACFLPSLDAGGLKSTLNTATLKIQRVSGLLILLLNDNTTHLMQPSTPPTIKQTQEQSPPVPNILRSRQKIPLPEDDPLRRIREFVHLPQEIIIDARKYNQQHPSHRDRPSHPQHDGIRSQIDACLSAVAKVYDQQHKRRGGKTIANQGKIDSSEPIISANSIHRVDAHLILKYIGTISEDYGIPNRFENARTSIISNPRPQIIQPSPKNPEERFTSVEKMRGKSRKSFIHMTLSTNRQKREDSASKPNPKRQSNHRYSPSTNHTPKRTDVRTNHPTSATRPLQQSQIKIQEEFKYCINCEKSILVKNIEYHERYECKQLEGIYKMSFHQLRDFVNAKINRMRQQIQESIAHLREVQKARSSEFPQVDLKDQLCENVVKSIEHYVKSTASMQQPISDNHLHEEYFTFQQNLKSQFFQCINLTHRLDYFMKVYFKINDQLALPLSLSHQHSCEYILKNTPSVRIETNAHQKTSSDRLADDGYRLIVKPVSDFQHGQ